jgi:hypothetical protein
MASIIGQGWEVIRKREPVVAILKLPLTGKPHEKNYILSKLLNSYQ